jgi:hypothetical protein
MYNIYKFRETPPLVLATSWRPPPIRSHAAVSGPQSGIPHRSFQQPPAPHPTLLPSPESSRAKAMHAVAAFPHIRWYEAQWWHPPVTSEAVRAVAAGTCRRRRWWWWQRAGRARSRPSWVGRASASAAPSTALTSGDGTVRRPCVVRVVL